MIGADGVHLSEKGVATEMHTIKQIQEKALVFVSVGGGGCEVRYLGEKWIFATMVWSYTISVEVTK